jgi:hypothetical protein
MTTHLRFNDGHLDRLVAFSGVPDILQLVGAILKLGFVENPQRSAQNLAGVKVVTLEFAFLTKNV